ncbi:hypothetical protein Bhyg_01531 [Pseudolycoriella hygida]|uniref:Uncharacterized protein n=1 Tax=Pseudolycoriella hygida TaxID=35572 RepID=A0A9Q0N9P9_9DIPT|nr:hypothetical protein Bhyg_01531 [Pseudolycoriella hygida]
MDTAQQDSGNKLLSSVRYGGIKPVYLKSELLHKVEAVTERRRIYMQNLLVYSCCNAKNVVYCGICYFPLVTAGSASDKVVHFVSQVKRSGQEGQRKIWKERFKFLKIYKNCSEVTSKCHDHKKCSEERKKKNKLME